ncbi:ubiquitin carboxyl-terminal hydrolase 7-like [Cebidichthys violaceus]|uniref:ubiquitin carboxyl-terminal hydrolase 7-like n=1 Tax=Cebidichthys violaceus TaxID=271503 RepID=UPI0035C982DC
MTLTQRRHYGLYNQGATCYLNSVLQVLSMTTEIHHRLDPTKQTDLHLRKIFEDLKKKTCGTKTITAAFRIQNVYKQRDAAEILEMILREISPEASEGFKGKLTDTTKCSRGHTIIEESDPFWTLPLSLNDTRDSSYSVERGFERIFQPKSLNGVYCNDCEETTEATSGHKMVCPQILILLLKRFHFDNNTGRHFKSNRRVNVPRTLKTKDKRYELYAVVNHSGSLRGGHYTATILSKEDRTWYEFDDAHVYKVKEQLFAETRTYKSSTAYLLVYRASAKHDDTNQIPRRTPNTRNSRRRPDTIIEMENDESSPQVDNSPTCKMTPIRISLIVIGVLVAIPIIVLPIIFR